MNELTNERSSDGPCKESDGCPTELAVLKRFWREHQSTPSAESAPRSFNDDHVYVGGDVNGYVKRDVAPSESDRLATKPWTMFEKSPGRYLLNCQSISDGTLNKTHATYIIERVNELVPATPPSESARKPFDEWWDAHEAQFSADALHMSEYHMASVVWEAARQHFQPATIPEARVTDYDLITLWDETADTVPLTDLGKQDKTGEILAFARALLAREATGYAALRYTSAMGRMEWRRIPSGRPCDGHED